MSKLAFIFPGQGAQYIGMGKELYDNYDSASQIFETASQSLEFDLVKMVFEGNQDTLTITENTQPAILATSIACLKVLSERKITPDYVAGLSLGEYSAHVASNSIEFSDAVKLVRKRGKFMQEAVPEGKGTMAAIIGLENEQVIDLCHQASKYGIVEPANFNCPGQVVISGEILAIEEAIEIAQLMNAKRALKLAVSAPFHCSMLVNAGNMLKCELANIEIKDMQIPVVTNVTGEIVNNKSEIKDLLINQVSKSVLWEKSIKTMILNGVDTFIEVGPGKVLGGFIRKIDKDVNIMNVEDIESLEKTLEKLS